MNEEWIHEGMYFFITRWEDLQDPESVSETWEWQSVFGGWSLAFRSCSELWTVSLCLTSLNELYSRGHQISLLCLMLDSLRKPNKSLLKDSHDFWSLMRLKNKVRLCSEGHGNSTVVLSSRGYWCSPSTMFVIDVLPASTFTQCHTTKPWP